MKYSQKNRLFLAAGAAVLLVAVIGAIITFSRGSDAPFKQSANQTITFDYQDKDYRPQTERVKAGNKVSITVKSAVEDEVHFHGYDISKSVGPGMPAAISFTADKTGRFELELESSGTLLGYIEVYP